MGVYIKGITMPKNCMECPFSDHEAWCLIPGDFKERYYCPTKEISEHCPLVEVPTPHGRLIDADALMNIFADRLVKVSERYGIISAVAGAVSGAMKLLDDQLPVIEAEGSNDTRKAKSN